jgi:hypothetical protein
MSFRGVTRPMRSLPLVVVLVAVVGAVSSPQSAAVETGPSRPAKAPPLLGVSYGSPRGTLAWFEPMTLKMLPGRKVQLGGHFGSWAFSNGRRFLALGSCEGPGARTPGIRFVDAHRMRVQGDLPLSPYRRGCASALTWLRPERLVAVVSTGTASASEVVVVNTRARRVLRRSPLPSAPTAVGRSSEDLVLLFSSFGEFAPARLAVVDSEGTVRMRGIERILAGTVVDATSTEYRARTIQPGLAIDPDGRRAFVVPASGPVAEVDLVTLDVSYHELDPPSLLGRLLRWLTPAAQAKVMEGPVREARWLGDGMLAVSGTDYSVEAPTSGAERFLQAPAGVRLIDTRSWTSRVLEPEASGFAVGAGLVVAQGGRWDSEEDRGYGPGLRAFGLDGRERWRLHAGEYRWMDTAGSVGYVRIAGDNADVVDLASGAVVSRVAREPFAQLLAGQSSSW